MQMPEWVASCSGRFDSVEFAKAVEAHLAAIRDAPTIRDRAREAGRFGGFMRAMRSAARLELAKAMIRELEVEPTQHVASMLMLRAFEQAAETATLDYFAKPGRDASKKYMDAARTAAAQQPGVIARYGHMYDWYIDRLDLVIARLKGKKARPRPQPDPAGLRPPTRPTSRPQLRRVK